MSDTPKTLKFPLNDIRVRCPQCKQQHGALLSYDRDSSTSKCLRCGHQWREEQPNEMLSSFTKAEQDERWRDLERLYDMHRADDRPVPWSGPEFLPLMYEWAEMVRPKRVATGQDDASDYDVMWWAFFKGVVWGHPEERIAQLQVLDDPRAQRVIAHIRWVLDGPLPDGPMEPFYRSYWSREIFDHLHSRREAEAAGEPFRGAPPFRELSTFLQRPISALCPACGGLFGMLGSPKFQPARSWWCLRCKHRWDTGEPRQEGAEVEPRP